MTEAAVLGLQNLQGTYDASTATPHVTVNATNGPVTFRDHASVPQAILRVEDGAGALVAEWTESTVTVGVAGSVTISSPGAGSLSEHFGSGSLAAGANGTAVGQSASASAISTTSVGRLSAATASSASAFGVLALASGVNSLSIGTSSDATTSASTAVGVGAQATTSTNTTAVGAAALATGADGTVFGASASDGGNSSCVVIGKSASATGVSATVLGRSSSAGAHGLAFGDLSNAAGGSMALGSGSESLVNEFVAGATLVAIEEVYFGRGKTSTAASATLTFHSTGGFGLDDVGTSVVHTAGPSTGDAASATWSVQTGTPGVSSSTPQTLTTRLSISDTAIVIGSADDEDVTVASAGGKIGLFGTTPVVQPTVYAVATGETGAKVLLANASATAANNNDLLAALIIDFQALGAVG